MKTIVLTGGNRVYRSSVKHVDYPHVKFVVNPNDLHRIIKRYGYTLTAGINIENLSTYINS